MHVKKILLIGIISLVVIGCVLAAGCTSTPTVAPTTAPTTSTTPTPTQVASTVDPWLGVWSCTNYKTADGTVYNTAVLILKADGIAYWILADSEGRLAEGSILEESWVKTGSATFTVTNPKTGKSYNYVYDAAKPSLTVSQGDITNVFTRFGDITSPETWNGLWGSSNYIQDTGVVIKQALLAILNGGTAYWIATDPYVNEPVIEETWEKINDTTFTVKNPKSGKSYTYVYNSLKDSLEESKTPVSSNVFNRVGLF